MNRFVSLLVASLLLPVAFTAKAENLITGLSFDTISITSDFTGTELLVFGTVDQRPIGEKPRLIGDYDIYVTIEGPRTPTTVRRKERAAGIWINGASVDYLNMPGSYLTLGTRTMVDPLTEAALKEEGIGLDNLSFGRMPNLASVTHGPVFNEAVVRLKKEQGLFQESDELEILGENLFRARFAIPALVPVGDHTVRTYLLFKGELIAKTTANLTIKKIGFEQFMYEMAHQYGYLYGIVAVLIAMLTGWLGSVLFRRDK